MNICCLYTYIYNTLLSSSDSKRCTNVQLLLNIFSIPKHILRNCESVRLLDFCSVLLYLIIRTCLSNGFCSAGPTVHLLSGGCGGHLVEPMRIPLHPPDFERDVIKTDEQRHCNTCTIYTYNNPDRVTLPTPSGHGNYKADELIVRVPAMTLQYDVSPLTWPVCLDAQPLRSYSIPLTLI